MHRNGYVGGYDPRVEDSVRTLHELITLIRELGLTYSLSSQVAGFTDHISPTTAEIVLLLNFTSPQRSALLNSPSTLALLYTPSNEHFGIGPIEGMICGLPILACSSGGPTESVRDLTDDPSLGTGWLREPRKDVWAMVMDWIWRLTPEERKAIGARCRESVGERFTMESMSGGIEKALLQAWRMGVVRWGYGLILCCWIAGLAVGYLGLISRIVA